MVDEPLEQRAGKNIGVITSLYPRIKSGRTKLVALPAGPSDTVLWTCPDDVPTLFIGTIDFFQNAVAPPVTVVDLIFKSPPNMGGVEHPLIPVNVAASAGITSTQFVSPFTVPVALVPGEKLIMRVSDPLYTGGMFVEASAGVIYGGMSIRKQIGTNLTEIIKPPPGKGLGAVNAGIDYDNNLLFPFFLVNSDTVQHNVDIIIHEDGVDNLVLQNLPVPPNSSLIGGVPLNSVGADQIVKALIHEPVVTPGKSVIVAAFYMLVDSSPESF